MMRLISIDPGVNGALAYWHEGKVKGIMDLHFKEKQLDVEWMLKIISGINPDAIVIEKVATSPNQGVVGAGTFMFAAGQLDGICRSQWKVEYLRPQKWKATTGLTNLAKKASVGKAIMRVPSSEPFIMGHKNSIDRADATLIGYAYLLLNGEAR